MSALTSTPTAPNPARAGGRCPARRDGRGLRIQTRDRGAENGKRCFACRRAIPLLPLIDLLPVRSAATAPVMKSFR